MEIGFIGAGKVGFTLGKYLSEKGLRVAGYYSRGTESATDASKFTNTKAYDDLGEIIKDCDVLFLTVPDGVINDVYSQLLEFSIKGKIICHASGAMSSMTAFPEIEKAEAFGYSVHPLFAVSDKYHAYEELVDVFFAVEGTGPIENIGKILDEAGLNWQEIDSKGKTKYHLAAAMASNLVVALMSKSIEMLKDVGFDEKKALKALAPLVTGNVKHILEDGPMDALTGPIERGDSKTVKKHLEVMNQEEDKMLYKLLSKELVKIAEEKHPERSYEEINNILSI